MQKYEEAVGIALAANDEELKQTARRALTADDIKQLKSIAEELWFGYNIGHEYSLRWFEALGADRRFINSVFWEAESVSDED